MTQAYELASEFIDAELERSLLASMIADPETVYFACIDYLTESTFSAHAEDFLAVALAIEDRTPLPSIQDLPPPHPEPEAAAQRLADLYQKRLLAAQAQQFLVELRGERSASELKAMLEGGLAEVDQAMKQLTAGKVTSVVDLLPEVLADIRLRKATVDETGSAVVGMPTGFPRLDELLGGLPLEGSLITLGAPPGAGKTSFALHLLRNVVGAGHPALFCSFEETLPRLAAKCLASAAGLELKRFHDGLSDPAIMEEAARRFGPGLRQLYLHQGTHKTTLPELRAKFLRILNRSQSQSGVIVIDYLQRAINSLSQSGEYRHQIDQFVGLVRELSVRLKVPILMISAQNRASMGSGHLSSFRDSSAIEYSSDVAMFLVPDDNRMVQSPNRAMSLVVAKNRLGDVSPNGIPMVFNPALGTFAEEE